MTIIHQYLLKFSKLIYARVIFKLVIDMLLDFINKDEKHHEKVNMAWKSYEIVETDNNIKIENTNRLVKFALKSSWKVTFSCQFNFINNFIKYRVIQKEWRDFIEQNVFKVKIYVEASNKVQLFHMFPNFISLFVQLYNPCEKQKHRQKRQSGKTIHPDIFLAFIVFRLEYLQIL